MLNNRKVRLMTRLAVYEQSEGREDVRLSKYFRSDYVRLQTLKTAVAVTVGYLFVLLILVVYHSEYLIQNAVVLDYRGILLRYVGIYIILLAVYIALSTIGYMIKYRTSRKKLSKYFRMLRRLRSLYKEEDGEEENIEHDGINT